MAQMKWKETIWRATKRSTITHTVDHHWVSFDSDVCLIEGEETQMSSQRALGGSVEAWHSPNPKGVGGSCVG